MAKPIEMKAIKVNGRWWRCERYAYKTCHEVLVRGPFKSYPFKSNGAPVFMRGHHTAWKMIGNKPMSINPKKSKKALVGDPIVLPDWKPFYAAYIGLLGPAVPNTTEVLQ
jgi:hypothetical protein